MKKQRELLIQAKTIMSLWPSKKQWKSWTLPSKYTAIGLLVGIVALLFFAVGHFSRPDWTDIVRTMGEKNRKELSKRYFIAHTVFGVYQDGFIVPKGQMPEDLEIEWDTGKIQSINNNILMITLPNVILNGKFFVGGNKTLLEKRIGAKSGAIIRIGWFDPRLEVIGIHDELVVVALGFPAGDSKNQ